MNLKIDHYKMSRFWLESLVMIYDVHKFLTEISNKVYSIDEISTIILNPFYSNANTFLPLIKTICDYWVIEGKIDRIDFNGELFHHAL